MLLFEQMSVLAIIMVIGFVANRLNMINEEASKKISAIVVYIANPALILSGAIQDSEGISGKDLLLMAIVALATYACLILLAQIIPSVIRTKERERNTYKAMTVFSNIGFMGFPLISATLGSGALLYASVFLFPFNVLLYTYGIHCLSGGGTKKSFKIKKVFNIGVVACMAAIAIYLLKLQLPAFVVKTTIMLSNLTAPLSMLVIGASFSSINFKGLISDIRLIVFSLVKMIAVPILGIWLLSSFIGDRTMIMVTAVILSTPIGSMTAMLSREYGGEYALTVKGIALTAVSAVITMPLVSLVIEWLI